MKNLKRMNWQNTLILSIGFILTIGCERKLSDDVDFETFTTNGDIFTDNPVGLTDEFFVSFDPNFGANTEGFGTDNDVAYQGQSSIRIDVPVPDDPNGGFIGGIFLDRGEGRDLTGFDALTFYAKGSTTAIINEVGFGTDFVEDKFAVKAENIRLSTDWRKVIIPIPDPSKLIQERGMFFFATGTQSTNGIGFTIWIDELRFEKLGTIAQSRPSILGGNDSRFPTTAGESLTISQLQQTFNLASGIDQTIFLAPAYFDFVSSNPDVAFVNELGEVTVISSGTTEISASIAGVRAAGGITVESSETASIISVFSDLFADIPVDNYNGFFLPDGQTTLGGVVSENGNQIIDYTMLNFVAIEFYGREGSGIQPADASDMNLLNLDIRVNENIESSDFLNLILANDVGGSNFSQGTFEIPTSELITNEWVSFQIPISSFTGLADKNAVGQLFFVSDGTIANISVDNIFFSVD